MMVHHIHIMTPECHAKRLGSCLHGQGHSAGSNPQKINISRTFEPFATRFGIVAHHLELECCVTISFGGGGMGSGLEDEKFLEFEVFSYSLTRPQWWFLPSCPQNNKHGHQ